MADDRFYIATTPGLPVSSGDSLIRPTTIPPDEDEYQFIIIPGTDSKLASRVVQVQRRALDDTNGFASRRINILRRSIETTYFLLLSRRVNVEIRPVDVDVDYVFELSSRSVTAVKRTAKIDFKAILFASSRSVQLVKRAATLRFSLRKFITDNAQILIKRSELVVTSETIYVFPSLRPTRRAFTPPIYIINSSSAQNGSRVRTLLGSKPSNATLSLTYENIPDATAAEILSIFDLHDRIRPVTLPEDVFSGSSGDLKAQTQLSDFAGLDWYFAAPPEVESVQTGISTVNLSFTSRRKDNAVYSVVTADRTNPVDESVSVTINPVCYQPIGESPGFGDPARFNGWSYVFSAFLVPQDQVITQTIHSQTVPDSNKARLIWIPYQGLTEFPVLTSFSDGLTIPELGVTETLTGLPDGSIEARAEWPQYPPGVPTNWWQITQVTSSISFGNACTNFSFLICPEMTTLRPEGYAVYGDVDPSYMQVRPGGTNGYVAYRGDTTSNQPANFVSLKISSRFNSSGNTWNYISGSAFGGGQMALNTITDGAAGYGINSTYIYWSAMTVFITYVPPEIGQAIRNGELSLPTIDRPYFT